MTTKRPIISATLTLLLGLTLAAVDVEAQSGRTGPADREAVEAGSVPAREGQDAQRGRSYDQLHAEFHRELDSRYQRLAAERPLDIAYRLRLRAEKRAEHEEWHRRIGIAHD